VIHLPGRRSIDDILSSPALSRLARRPGYGWSADRGSERSIYAGEGMYGAGTGVAVNVA
jgi:hypothetical protein